MQQRCFVLYQKPLCLMDADIKLHVIFCNIYAHDAIWTKQHCSNWFSSLCDSSQYGFYKSNMIKALFFRGTTNVAFELCDIAQIGALLRVHRPDFVLAKNTIQFLPEVFSSSNCWPNEILGQVGWGEYVSVLQFLNELQPGGQS